MIPRVRESLLCEVASFCQTPTVVQRVDEVGVCASHIIDAGRLQPDLESLAENSDASVEVAKVEDRHAQRVESVALDLTRTDATGHGDGLLADRFRLFKGRS